ncbi:sulfatase-like hydrolase/transferase [Halobellus clavatus]|uniref:Arylsulfatase A n=1 Tax=Halobellus clavatus TaxID=660517 RepID=A0A1H3JYJ7_9EURY|nr:sulfatase-like hydrolase/transferase [Halobellus clavatus]SDY44575.1 Arylsulfatase A [Halobellus clavatus]
MIGNLAERIQSRIRGIDPGSASYVLNRVRDYRDSLVYNLQDQDVGNFNVENPKDVIIITVDCLRNDHTTSGGHKRDTTPYLSENFTHTEAISPASWTYSAVPSLLTGRYPHNHGARYDTDSMRDLSTSDPPYGVRDECLTIAEVLDSLGYNIWFGTAIEMAAIPLRGRIPSINRRHDADAEALISEVQEWWNQTQGPKFGYVHLGDPHEPLHQETIKKAEADQFGPIPDIDGLSRWRFRDTIRPTDEFEGYREGRELLYDSAIRYVDDCLSSIMEAVDDDTLIFVTGDHGEEFWEYYEFEKEHFDDPRGYYGTDHGHALVPPVIEVPIFTNQNITKTDGFASLVDIVPTVYSELSVSPVPDTDGISLTENFDRPVLSQEIAYGNNQLSVTHKGEHIITVPENGGVIHLDYDTFKEQNRTGRTDDLLDYLPDSKHVGEDSDVSAEARQRLEDLGYAE